MELKKAIFHLFHLSAKNSTLRQRYCEYFTRLVNRGNSSEIWYKICPRNLSNQIFDFIVILIGVQFKVVFLKIQRSNIAFQSQTCAKIGKLFSKNIESVSKTEIFDWILQFGWTSLLWKRKKTSIRNVIMCSICESSAGSSWSIRYSVLVTSRLLLPSEHTRCIVYMVYDAYVHATDALERHRNKCPRNWKQKAQNSIDVNIILYICDMMLSFSQIIIYFAIFKVFNFHSFLCFCANEWKLLSNLLLGTGLNGKNVSDS